MRRSTHFSASPKPSCALSPLLINPATHPSSFSRFLIFVSGAQFANQKVCSQEIFIEEKWIMQEICESTQEPFSISTPFLFCWLSLFWLSPKRQSTSFCLRSITVNTMFYVCPHDGFSQPALATLSGWQGRQIMLLKIWAGTQVSPKYPNVLECAAHESAHEDQLLPFVYRWCEHHIPFSSGRWPVRVSSPLSVSTFPVDVI